MTQTFVCMKWGRRYGPEYVNRLANMIRRHTRRPSRLVCYTDDASEVDSWVECHPLPPIALPEEIAWTPWRKLSLWRDDLKELEGDVLFFDLDLVITGSLDEFFDHCPGEFCVVRNWTQAKDGIGNTSVFRFLAGSAPHLVERMESEPQRIRASYRNEQIFVTRELNQAINFWPQDWCLSFKHNLVPRWPLNFLKVPQLPPDARIVVFTGKPDPDEAVEGRWPAPWYKKTYKHVRPTPWINENWR